MIEVVLAEHAHADAQAGWRVAGSPQYKAMVTGFLDATQIERVTILLRHHEADYLGVEQPASVEILDGQDRMAAARDIERRVMMGARQFHHDGSFKTY